jgi:hypothetical protein
MYEFESLRLTPRKKIGLRVLENSALKGYMDLRERE